MLLVSSQILDTFRIPNKDLASVKCFQNTNLSVTDSISIIIISHDIHQYMNGCSQLCTHIKVFHSWCMLITALQWSDKHLWQMSPPQSRCFLPPCHNPATAQGSPHLSPVEHLVTMTTDGYHTNTDATIGHRKVYSQVYTPHLTLVIIPHSWGSCRSSGQEEPLSSWSLHHIVPPERYCTQEWG